MSPTLVLLLAAQAAGIASKTPCQVALLVEHQIKGHELLLTASAQNKSDKPITITAPDGCPGGPLRFTGFPEGYDLYRSCMKGACFGPRKRVQWLLPPGKKVTLANVSLDLDGAPCAPPLRPRIYKIGFVPMDEVASCVVAPATVEIAAPAHSPRKPAKP